MGHTFAGRVSDFLIGPESIGPAAEVSVTPNDLLLPHKDEQPGFTRFSTGGVVTGYRRPPERGEDYIDWSDAQGVIDDNKQSGVSVSHYVDVQPPLSDEHITPAAEVISRHLLAAQLGETGLSAASIAQELSAINVPFNRLACSAVASQR